VNREGKETLQMTGKNKLSLHTRIEKQPDLEAYLKNWMTDHRNSGISVSTEVKMFKKNGGCSDAASLIFIVTTSWCYGSVKRHGLSICNQNRITKMCQPSTKRFCSFRNVKTKILQF
jgi:hypothetical protein